jgi:hypothetical protein
MGYCLLQARNNNLNFSGAGMLSISAHCALASVFSNCHGTAAIAVDVPFTASK